MANIQIPENLFYDIIRYYLIASKGEKIPEELDKRGGVGYVKTQ